MSFPNKFLFYIFSHLWHKEFFFSRKADGREVEMVEMVERLIKRVSGLTEGVEGLTGGVEGLTVG